MTAPSDLIPSALIPVEEFFGLRNETEGHWFINQESNIELYRTLERFLARHLGGRTEHTTQGK